MPQSLRRGLLLRGVGATSSRSRGEVSQGSSFLATLGFIAESLWDSLDGRTPPRQSMMR